MPNGMSTARMRATTRFFSVNTARLAVCLLLGACGPESDEVVPLIGQTRPAAGQQWPADEPLVVEVDRWLEPSSVSAAAVTLTSGELTAGVRIQYDPVGPSLMVRPDRALRPGLGYVLTVDGSAFEALGGGPGHEVRAVSFEASFPSGWQAPPAPSDEEMADLFAGRCGCHGAEQMVFPTLDRAGLVGVESRRQPGRSLVVPGRPMDSHLVLKVLADYPGVRGMQKTLSDDERRQIVRWVRNL